MPVVTSSPIIDELRAEIEKLTAQLDKRTAALEDREHDVAQLAEQVTKLRAVEERAATESALRASLQRRIAVGGAIVAGVAVAVLSASATADVALALGVAPGRLAWFAPLAIEGSACASVALWAGGLRRARWAALVALAMTVAANVAHVGDSPPSWLGWVLASGVPVLLALTVEGLMGSASANSGGAYDHAGSCQLGCP